MCIYCVDVLKLQLAGSGRGADELLTVGWFCYEDTTTQERTGITRYSFRELM